MTPMNSPKDRIDQFPDFIAKNYGYSEYTEYYGEDKEAAAQEVRADVRVILQNLRGHVADEKIVAALDVFIDKYPVGQDLDKELGALGFGMERVLGNQLINEFYVGVDKELAEQLEELVEIKFHPDTLGDITDYRIFLVKKAKVIQKDLKLDAMAAKLVLSNIIWMDFFDGIPFNHLIGRLKNYFKNARLTTSDSRSAFIKEQLDPRNFSADFWYDLHNESPVFQEDAIEDDSVADNF